MIIVVYVIAQKQKAVLPLLVVSNLNIYGTSAGVNDG